MSERNARRLKDFIERLERLEAEMDALRADVKEVVSEASLVGYSPRIIRKVLALRRMPADEREEEDALLQLYLAELGMLGEDALRGAALRRIQRSRAKKPEDDPGEPGLPLPPGGQKPDGAGADEAAEPPAAPPPPWAQDTIDDARAKGAEAARAGAEVTTNPYPAGDPRRAAWDESWCQAAGSDGMDIPDFLKPKKKPKKDEGDEGGDE